MDFRLHPLEPLESAVQRIALELVADAREQLQLEGEQRHSGIHQARKDFKKVRAMLRLVRSSLGENFAFENQRFGRLGRSLSATRDREAMVEAFDSFAEQDGVELSADLARRTREYLVSRSQESIADAGEPGETRPALRAELERVAQEIVTWRIRGEGFSALEDGLRRGFRAARRTGRDALSNPGPASFHAWRKRSKVHWYHARLLADVWVGEGEQWRQGLASLNDILGDYQDGQLLIELADSGIPNYTRFESDHLRQLLRRRQNRLRDEAAQRAAPYLAKKPSAITAHVRVAWGRASEES